MDLDRLYEILELDTPSDFAYFEQMAELIECDEEIPFDLFYDALSLVDSETLGNLVENYFEDFSNAIPDSDDDFVCLVDSIKQKLILLAEDIENTRREFAEKLFDFRTWLHTKDGATIDKAPCSVIEAVTENRVQKLGGQEHTYSFPSVSDYEIEDLSLNLGKYSKIDILKEENEDNSKNLYN